MNEAFKEFCTKEGINPEGDYAREHWITFRAGMLAAADFSWPLAIGFGGKEMKATREQVAALAKEAANAAKIYIHEEGDAEFLERLVHLAQRFERDRLLAQQVCIKQKDAALQRCTKFTQEDYDALALQPDLSALREHDAEVCQEFANFLGIEKCEDVVKWIGAVRKGE